MSLRSMQDESHFSPLHLQEIVLERKRQQTRQILFGDVVPDRKKITCIPRCGCMYRSGEQAISNSGEYHDS